MVLNAGAVHAQVLPSGRASLALLPLKPMSMTLNYGAVPLGAIADDVNTHVAGARWHGLSYRESQPSEPSGFSLDQLPVIGDLVDEKGNFDWGMDLPVSVNVGSVLGAYGVTVDMDFSL